MGLMILYGTRRTALLRHPETPVAFPMTCPSADGHRLANQRTLDRHIYPGSNVVVRFVGDGEAFAEFAQRCFRIWLTHWRRTKRNSIRQPPTIQAPLAGSLLICSSEHY